MNKSPSIEDFQKFQKEHPGIIEKWQTLFTQKKCFMCNEKFPDGWFAKKEDNKNFPMPTFRGDFIFHTFTTHGLNEEDIDNFIKNTK